MEKVNLMVIAHLSIINGMKIVTNMISKETYEAPTLVAHGTIEEMTQANSVGALLDSTQQAGGVPLLS